MRLDWIKCINRQISDDEVEILDEDDKIRILKIDL